MTHNTVLSGDEGGISMGAYRTLKTFIIPTLGLALAVLPSVASAYALSNFEKTAPNITESAKQKYGDMINIAALLHDYDEKLILSVMVVESEGHKNAKSNRGAQGLMQLMPETAKAMGAKDPKEPFQNILAGTRYLKELEESYGFNHKEALVAYNMGPSRAKRWLSQYSPDESMYVQKVMRVYNYLEEQNAADDNTATSTVVATGILTKPKTLSLIDHPTSLLNTRRVDVTEE